MSDGWDEILEKDEDILWQPPPRAGVDFTHFVSLGFLFGLFFAGFAVFWMNMASTITGSFRDDPFGGIFAFFGIPFLLIGLFMAFGKPFWGAFRRSKTNYTLTTKNAYIASNVLGKRSLHNHPIADMTKLNLVDGTPGTLWFAKKFIQSTSRQSGRRRTHTYATPISFERIDDVRTVYGPMRDIQTQGTEK